MNAADLQNALKRNGRLIKEFKLKEMMQDSGF